MEGFEGWRRAKGETPGRVSGKQPSAEPTKPLQQHGKILAKANGCGMIKPRDHHPHDLPTSAEDRISSKVRHLMNLQSIRLVGGNPDDVALTLRVLMSHRSTSIHAHRLSACEVCEKAAAKAGACWLLLNVRSPM